MILFSGLDEWTSMLEFTLLKLNIIDVYNDRFMYPTFEVSECICNIVVAYVSSMGKCQVIAYSFKCGIFFTLVSLNALKAMYTLITPDWPSHTDALHNADGPQQGLYCRGPIGPADNYLLITLQHLRSSHYSPHQHKHCEGISISMVTQYHSVTRRLAISFGHVVALVWVD